MKVNSAKYFIIVAWILLSFMSGCNKEAAKDNPIVPTLPTVRFVGECGRSNTMVCFNAEVTSDGGAAVTERGVCWCMYNRNPTIRDEKSTTGTGVGSYTCWAYNLELCCINYHYCAYATNSFGTAYESWDDFVKRTQ